MNNDNKAFTSIILLSLLLILGIEVYPAADVYAKLPQIAYAFMVGWLLLAILFCCISYKDFITGFLISLFATLVSWRIAAIYNIAIIMIPMTFVFILYFANFLYYATMNIKYPERYQHQLSIADWQIVFLRLYIGLNFIPHFTEKLFAGSAPHMADVTAFISLGVPHPDLFVWLAGLCEFGAAIAIALGFFLRLGALGATLYLFIATYLGHHFSLGFIWAGPGGGWEFATMWMVLVFSFVVTGTHQFSLDQRIEETYSLPNVIKKLL